MKRTFTKYPQGYIKASSESSKDFDIFEFIYSYQNHVDTVGDISIEDYARDYFENLDNDELVDVFIAFCKCGIGGTDNYAEWGRAAQRIVKDVVLERLNS